MTQRAPNTYSPLNAAIFDVADLAANPDGYANESAENERRAELRDELYAQIRELIGWRLAKARYDDL